MARKYTTRQRVETLLQTRTQKQLAAELGVSVRTIRRWKNENVEPTKAHAPKLTRAATRERSILNKRAEGTTRGLAVPPPAHRRQIMERIGGKPTGNMVASSWINYKVDKLDGIEQFELLRTLRDQGKVAQIIFTIRGGEHDGKRSATRMIDLSGYSDSELWELLEQTKKSYKKEREPEEGTDEDLDEGEELDEAETDNRIDYIGALDR